MLLSVFPRIILCNIDSCRGEDESDHDSNHDADEADAYTPDAIEAITHCAEQEQCSRSAEMLEPHAEALQNASAPVEPEPIGDANLQSKLKTDVVGALKKQAWRFF